jgi:hypothetical protein
MMVAEVACGELPACQPASLVGRIRWQQAATWAWHHVSLVLRLLAGVAMCGWRVQLACFHRVYAVHV